jgi:formylglycine-generating enzyme required for sulfatase activity
MKHKLWYLIIIPILMSGSGPKIHPYKGFNLKAFEKTLMFIPSGSFHYGSEEQDGPIGHLFNNAFYMCNHEVSNGEYLEFINDLAIDNKELSKSMLPDTLVWRNRNTYKEPFVYYYFRHPGYSQFPVVGITYEQAAYYCIWLTQKYAKKPKRKFEQAVFSIPSKGEWCHAAHGGKERATFPWEELSMQDNKGNWSANFKIIPQNAIYYAAYIGLDTATREYKWYEKWRVGNFAKDNSLITTPVISYKPNKYGLYNMAGNVEEYVLAEPVQSGFWFKWNNKFPERKPDDSTNIVRIAKGGSWNDVGSKLEIMSEEVLDSNDITSAERGFRIAMEVK